MGAASLCAGDFSASTVLDVGNCRIFCKDTRTQATAIQHGESCVSYVLEPENSQSDVESNSFLLQILAADVRNAFARYKLCFGTFTD